MRDEVAADALCRGLPDGRRASDYRIRPYTIDAPIADGAVIDLGDRVLTVLHVPGHTPDAVALLDRANGLLWTVAASRSSTRGNLVEALRNE